MTKFIKSNSFFFILLFLVVFVVYGKSVNFGISTLDDDIFIVNNIHLISNPKNIPKFFLMDCYFEKTSQYYRPVLIVSFAIEAALFKDNIKIYHLTNILLYILALFVIFVFLSELKFNINILKFLLLLFAVHPVLSSVPVWIPARNDTLLTIFFLSALINFIKYIETNKTKYLILNFLFFSLSLFTKETTVLLIFIYPLLIYCFKLKTNKKQIIFNISFLVILLTFYFILRHHSIRHIDTLMFLKNYTYYITNIFVGIMLYIEQIIYPENIHIMVYDLHLNLQSCIITFTVFISLLFFCYKQNKDLKKILFALVFSFLAILPTFFQEKNEYCLLTHRLIICLVGILIIMTLVFETLIKKFPKIKKYLFIVFAFLFILFSFCSFKQTDKYRDGFTYWSNAYSDAPNYHLTCDSLAKRYNEQQNFDKALELSSKALSLKKSFYYYLTYLNILINMNDIENAKSIALQMLNYWNKNVSLYQHTSNVYLMEKDFPKAIEFAKKSLELSEKSTITDKISSLENIVKIYSVSGNFQEAINALFKLLTYDRNNPKYYNLLSMLYEDLRDYDNSVIYANKAVALEPNNNEYIKQLSNIKSKISLLTQG